MTEPSRTLKKIDKGETQIVPNNNQIDMMTEKMQEICNLLLCEEFDVKETTKVVIEYLDRYHRILYSPISNEIYHSYDEGKAKIASERIGTISSNLEMLFAYTQTEEYKKNVPTTRAKKSAAYQDLPKTILKIWDHVNLAQQQYTMLKQSDEEYQKKFDGLIDPFKQELTKDMTAQLLTLIGIFTALAFLVFGGISSLDNIFSNTGLPIFKLMIVGSVWGLCIINLVFVFLFCVGKMTKMSFSSTKDPNATIYQKYPIVWWCDFIICAILILCMWGYYLTKESIHSWFDAFCHNHQVLVTLSGTGIIVLVLALIARGLLKKMQYTNNHDEQKINK